MLLDLEHDGTRCSAESRFEFKVNAQDQEDVRHRAATLGELGRIAWERDIEARSTATPETEIRRYFEDALRFQFQALDLTPQDHIEQLIAIHSQLGNVFADAKDLNRALQHYRESIRYGEFARNLYDVAQIQRNVALALLGSKRFADAREYALAALRNYRPTALAPRKMSR